MFAICALTALRRLDSFLDGTVRQKNIGLHYWSIMKILFIPDRSVSACVFYNVSIWDAG
jgi:hypothetical protein